MAIEVPKDSILCTIHFDEDFFPADTEGETGDVDALSVLLPTLFKSAENCSQSFDSGTFKTATTIGGGKVMEITFEESGVSYRQYVLSSYLLTKNDGLDRAKAYNNYPLFRDLPQITDAYRVIDGASWLGYRESANNQWQEVAIEKSLDSNLIRKGTLSALQIDVLLKGQSLPRSCIRLDYEKGVLWIWSSVQDDYMMCYLQGSPTAANARKIEHLGAAFRLGPIN